MRKHGRNALLRWHTKGAALTSENLRRRESQSGGSDWTAATNEKESGYGARGSNEVGFSYLSSVRGPVVPPHRAVLEKDPHLSCPLLFTSCKVD